MPATQKPMRHARGERGRLSAGDGIPIYLKLASLFRDRIASGAWPVGQQIGTLPELQAEYGVARATVQQAVRLLSEEGLLSSERGRGTFVTAPVERRETDAPAYDLLDLDPRFSIEVLHRGRAERCPDLMMPLPEGERPYMHIRKRHFLQNTPYSLVDLYLPLSVYEKLPAESDDTHRLYAQLIRDHTEVTRLEGRQTMTIALATQEQAELLGVSFASPLARIDSKLETGEGRQVMAHRAFIRGDLFMAHRYTGDILSSDPDDWRPTAPPGAVPQAPDPKQED
ncbi:GntR family transcriptional regulator [Antarcticimicrobium luteum]|uniref:GntR family transcriptional regulator n=1 Tax=Antarcticimicrobium luteum TaxID=2547397 RepID=UPI00140DFD44|nr:GntR family transcriptional regulator [Antarcticimicrobium luteum]